MNRRKPDIYPMVPTGPIWDVLAVLALLGGFVFAAFANSFFRSTAMLSAASIFAGFLLYVTIKTIRATPNLKPVYICVVLPLGLAIALALLPHESPWPPVICFATSVFAGLWFLVLKYPPQYRAASKAFRAGRYVEASQLLGLAIKTQPNSWESYHLLAVVHSFLHEPVEGERDARKAIELQPDNHNCYTALGAALLAQQKYGQARAAYRKALDLAPQYPINHYNLGLACYYLADFPAAIPYFRFALRNSLPDEFRMLGSYYLGSSLQHAGDPVAAQAAYKQLRKYRSAYEKVSARLLDAPDYPTVKINRRELEEIKTYLD